MKVQLFLIIVCFNITIFAQNPQYICALMNDSVTAPNIYEFDIYLLNIDSTVFEMALFQGGLTFNKAIKDSGILTLSWVPGSVDSAIVASGQKNILLSATDAGVIQIAPKLASGRAGTGAIISDIPPGTRVGRLRVQNSIPFAKLTPNIAWNFQIASSLYPTKIFAYVSGINTEITIQLSHLNQLTNPTFQGE